MISVSHSRRIYFEASHDCFLANSCHFILHDQDHLIQHYLRPSDFCLITARSINNNVCCSDCLQDGHEFNLREVQEIFSWPMSGPVLGSTQPPTQCVAMALCRGKAAGA
jgi:hypothetical protein